VNEPSPVQADPEASSQPPLLQAEHVQLYFPIKDGVLFDRTVGVVHAVDDVSLSLAEGETLGIVGESGCGKSTLARCIVRLLEPTSGTMRFRGRDITHLSRRPLQPFRREVQLVFQDPSSSLNPRKRVGQIVASPMRQQGMERDAARARVRELLDRVGLNPEHVNRFPHEFSGGQRQRIGLARALALQPELLVCDEPVSALDVSIQAQIINLLADLQQKLGLTYIFIAHDLSVVRHVSDRIAVMYLGRIVEIAETEALFAAPRHPYTQALLSAVPTPDPDLISEAAPITLTGDVPSPIHPPAGCRFHPRCPRAQSRCRTDDPVLSAAGGGGEDRAVACHFPISEITSPHPTGREDPA